MDIDKNDIRILAQRIPKILIESSFTLFKSNPKASFALFLIFLSYLFFSTIFWFLIYALPFIVLIAAISIKTYISVQKRRDAHKNEEEAKDDRSPTKVQSSEEASNENENKKYNALHARSVRRRKSKVTFIESMQDSIQEKGTISSTNLTPDLIDKEALVEEIPKDIRVVEENAVNDRIESSPSDVPLDFRSRFNSFMRSQINTEGTSSQNTEREGHEKREEERTANQGAEDDQKNLADDPGLSEIERNKRLENLIARRRAQKILSLPLRRTMMNLLDNDSPGQNIYPVVIQRRNPLSPSNYQFTPGPLSAPPIPNMRNPFDLPYEPHEEKPNLTSDGLHHELLGAPPKDIMFTRHESFSLRGGNLLEALGHVDVGERDEGKKVSQSQSQSQEVECDDKVESTEPSIQDQDSTQGPHLESVSHDDLPYEEKTKLVIVQGSNGRLSSSSSSEESEPISRLDKEKILKSLRSPHPPSMNIQNGGDRRDDHLFNYALSEAQNSKRPESFYYPVHFRSQSIASDMQVEVSEVSSPPQLSDMNISSPDEVRSLSDGKFEKEISDSEDMWISSSQLPRVDGNESRSREILEVGEKDITGVGSSTFEESKIPVERVIAQDSSHPHANFVSDSNIPGDSYVNNEHIILEQPNTSGRMHNSESGSRLDGEAQSLQEHPHPNNENSNTSGLMLHIGDIRDLRNSSQVNLQGGGDLQVLGEVQFQNHHRPPRVNDSTGESSQSGFMRDVEEMPQFIPTEGNYILQLTPNTNDEPSSIAIVTPETNQFFIQPNEVLSVAEILPEQDPPAISTSSSPKSVLNPRFSGSQGYMSNISDDIQMENQPSGGESSGSNSSSLPSQTAAPSAEDLTTLQFQERIQEPSTSLLVSAEEATSTSGRLNSDDINMNSTDQGQKQASETSFSYTNTGIQETNLDTISSNEEVTDQVNPSTSHSSELEKG